MPRISLSPYTLIRNLINYFSRERDNGGPLLPVTAVQERVAEALDVNVKTVYNVKKRCDFSHGSSNEEHVDENVSVKSRRPRIQFDENQRYEIRKVIYEMFSKREHVTLDTLLAKLKEQHLFDHSRSRLHRLLTLEMGFKFKKNNNRKALCEKKHVVVLRQRFLRDYVRYMQDNMYQQFVYLDETWIFAKGSFKRSWTDGSGKCVKHTNTEGKRFIILHAGSRSGFIEGASLVFSSGNKSHDYHDAMNSENFKRWVETQLLPGLKVPSIIIMDNASYHSEVLNRSPNTNWKKTDIQNWLQDNNLSYNLDMLKAELLEIVKNNRKEKQYVIDTLVTAYGHKVLRLPPYHCQFNPIEMVWGISKQYYDSHIGRDGYGDECVRAMWVESLSTITPDIWGKCINHTEKEILEWWEKEKIIEMLEVQPLIFSVNTGSSSDTSSDSSDNE